MARIEMYTRPFCPYCARARRLLADRGWPVEETSIRDDPAAEAAMVERSGRTAVPQIFIDGRHVGGSDDLAAADASGSLDRLLERAA